MRVQIDWGAVLRSGISEQQISGRCSRHICSWLRGGRLIYLRNSVQLLVQWVLVIKDSYPVKNTLSVLASRNNVSPWLLQKSWIELNVDSMNFFNNFKSRIKFKLLSPYHALQPHSQSYWGCSAQGFLLSLCLLKTSNNSTFLYSEIPLVGPIGHMSPSPQQFAEIERHLIP